MPGNDGGGPIHAGRAEQAELATEASGGDPMRETNAPDLGLTMTSAVGWGLFLEVPEGDYVVRSSSAGSVCDDTHPLGGWPAGDPEAVNTLVRARFLTLSMQLSCIDG